MSFVQGVSGAAETGDSGAQGKFNRTGVEDQVGSSVHTGGIYKINLWDLSLRGLFGNL